MISFVFFRVFGSSLFSEVVFDQMSFQELSAEVHADKEEDGIDGAQDAAEISQETQDFVWGHDVHLFFAILD